jgi:uncharacterized protein (DUF2249 family)
MNVVPAELAAAGTRQAVELDVRPIIARGGDPFRHIMSTVQTLAPEIALHLVVGFEPRPLYAVMRNLGRAAFVEQREGAFHVWFFRDGSSPSDSVERTGRASLAEPVHLDVRGLPPPEPMAVILERLAALGAGAQLLVRHHREPVLLYDKLTPLGFAARCERRAEGDYLVHIAPAWFFQDAAGH